MRITMEQFKERIEKGKVIPALLLLGDEPYLRDACRAALIDKFVPKAARSWLFSFLRRSWRNPGCSRSGTNLADAFETAGCLSRRSRSH